MPPQGLACGEPDRRMWEMVRGRHMEQIGGRETETDQQNPAWNGEEKADKTNLGKKSGEPKGVKSTEA